MISSKTSYEMRTFCIKKNVRHRFTINKVCYVIAAFAVFLSTFQYTTAGDKVLFRALAVRGNVTLRHMQHKDQAQVPLRTGQTITDSDELYIATDGFAGLIASSGSSVELKRPGRYKAADLAKQYGGIEKKSGVASKFAEYVATQMTRATSEESNSRNYQTKMETTGSVERAVGEQVDAMGKVIELATGDEESHENPQNNNIQRMTAVMPRSGKITGNRLDLSWQPEYGSTKYSILIRDGKHQVLLEQDITDGNSCIINLTPLHLKPNECYFWSVRPYAKDDDYRSDEYAICPMTQAEQKLIADTLAQLNSELGSLNTATAQLVIAAFYEQNELFASADICYSEAKRLAPDVEDIKEAARRFRARIGAPTE